MDDREFVGHLQIDEDQAFQRSCWKIQRVAWCAMGAVVVLGLLGVFGEGPIGGASAASEDGSLRLDFDRFERRERASEMTFTVRARPGTVRLWVDSAYLDQVEVERIEPPPNGREVESDGVSYLFALRGPDGSGRITFHIRPQSAGTIRGRARLNDRSGVSFAHFVYP